MRYAELAFVVDAVEFRESSALVHLLGEEQGRISLVAKGVRKPRGGGAGTGASAALQVFNLVRVEYVLKEGVTLGTMTGVELVRGWSGPRLSLETYALGMYWFEILREFSQAREGLGDVFEVTRGFLEGQEERQGFDLRYLAGLSDLFRYVGFGIGWPVCGSCGREVARAEWFSVRSGVMCGDCAGRSGGALRVDDGERRVIRRLSGAELGGGADHDLMENEKGALLGVLSLMHRFLVFHVERPVRSYDFLVSTVR